MNFKRFKKRVLGAAFVGFLGGGLLFSSNDGHAFAAESGQTQAIQQINGGVRDVSATSSTAFNSVNLDGSVQKTNADPGTLSIKDASGTGEGYRITVSATQFKTVTPSNGFASGTSARTLPKGSLLLKNTGATINAVGGTTSQKPNWTGSSWVIDSGSPVTILSANKDTGMGKYDIVFGSDNLELTLNPSTTYIDNVNYAGKSTPYETNITYTIISGP